MSARISNVWRRRSLGARRHKNSRFFYFVRGLGRLALPGIVHRAVGRRLLAEVDPLPAGLQLRLDYYYRVPGPFTLPAEADSLPLSRLRRQSNYWFDLAEHLRRVERGARVSYRFGDDTTAPGTPTLVKARTIGEAEGTSVLFKLNKARHYVFVRDARSFQSKRDMAVWRGAAHQHHRRKWVSDWFGHPCCDIGRTDRRVDATPWQRPYLSIDEQLQYKFVLSLEGNDVATNLKWVLSSNSLCFMPRPSKETWFMEGRLEPGVHYIELQPDLADLPEQVARWSRDSAAAERIIHNANRWTDQFRDPRIEDQLCLLVLKRYLADSGQFDVH